MGTVQGRRKQIISGGRSAGKKFFWGPHFLGAHTFHLGPRILGVQRAGRGDRPK